MDRAEILAMKPGPELDALVAEQVLGLCVHEWEKDARAVWHCGKCGEWSAYLPPWPPQDPYSQIILYGWQVVEKMHKDGYGVRLSDKSGATGSWWCYIGDAGAQGQDAPEAISKAALLAMEKENEPHTTHAVQG